MATFTILIFLIHLGPLKQNLLRTSISLLVLAIFLNLYIVLTIFKLNQELFQLRTHRHLLTIMKTMFSILVILTLMKNLMSVLIKMEHPCQHLSYL